MKQNTSPKLLSYHFNNLTIKTTQTKTTTKTELHCRLFPLYTPFLGLYRAYTPCFWACTFALATPDNEAISSNTTCTSLESLWVFPHVMGLDSIFGRPLFNGAQVLGWGGTRIKPKTQLWHILPNNILYCIPKY